MIRITFLAVAWMMPISVAWATEPFSSEAVAFFEGEVSPILEEHCFNCHDDTARGGLTFTTRAGLLLGGDQGPAFDAHAPSDSLFLEMLSYKDVHHEMPPSGKLDEDTLTVLTAWIEQGAPYPDDLLGEVSEGARRGMVVTEADKQHWAYQPVARPEVPAVDGSEWSANPIDAFIRHGLTARGLEPNPEAPRRVLIRRAYYDLTGLPPTPEEVAAFEADPDPDAYERLVDRLLASPHYGEKWGRHWLDVVRYAETNGYERDSKKPEIWRYRDYVIQSFNDDKPYDQFVMEQLAGDELPDAGPEQIIATGYYRLGLWDDEPADPKLGKYDTLDDIVDTTTRAFLGMTMSCARCHDHKIDPIPTRDYYSFLSFMHNISDMHRENITRSFVTAEDEAAYYAAVEAHQRSVRRLEGRVREVERSVVSKLDDMGLLATGNTHPSDMTNMQYREYRDTWNALPDFDSLRHENEGELSHNFFDIGVRRQDRSFGFVFTATLHVPEDGEYTFFLDSSDGSRLILDGETIINYDGIHLLGFEHRDIRTLSKGSYPIRLEYFQRGGQLGLQVAWSGPGFERRALSQERPEIDPPALIAEHGANVLDERTLERYHQSVRELAERRAYEVPGKTTVAAVFEAKPEPPETFVFIRGNPHVEGETVAPRFPEVLSPPEPTIQPVENGEYASTGRRRALAEWIASPENPLTARVMVNRIWQYHLGRGIARDPNDFGSTAEPPTHPELLDWLAAEFVETGWRMKPMHKQIMMSRTYRMASTPNAANHAADPRNDSFWRHDMRRLTAEEVRDSILAVNETLNPAVGGPSVFPPLPRKVLETSSRPDEAWGTSPPEEHTRRSVYIHLKRSLLEPLLADFDLADTDASCPVRFTTTQPTQALTMLNSEFVNEQALVLAESAREVRGCAESRVSEILERVTSRPATVEEVVQAMAFMDILQSEQGLCPERALDRFALLALNLNEFIFLD